MTENIPTTNITLHVWPGQWDLPSIEPLCLATLLYLQLAIPGKFQVAECNDPDLSPTGQLPFLVHGQHVISSFTPIVKYIAGLKNTDNNSYPNSNLDLSLNHLQKSQNVAWCAHVESNIGNLVYNMLYSVQNNWDNVAHPALVSMMSLPQKYYVPHKIRDSYRPRLEAAGLWNLPPVEKEEKQPFQKPEDFKTKDLRTQTYPAFEREKVSQKARSTLSIYTRLLGTRQYLNHDRVSSLDVMLAAHVLLLLNPPYSDPLTKNILLEEFPTIASHAQRIHALAFTSTNPMPKSVSGSLPHINFLRALIPSPSKAPLTGTVEKTAEERQYDKMRWGFFGLTLGCLAAYFVVVGRNIKIVVVRNT